jgi:hypothetical protein
MQPVLFSDDVLTRAVGSYAAATSDYRTVFDVAVNGYQTWRAAILPGSLSVAALIILVLLRSNFSPKSKSTRFYRGIIGAVAVAAAAGCVAMLVHTRREYDALRSSLRDRTFQVVEGDVVDFVPQGTDGHPIERFRVNSTRFEYSRSDITSAFHRTAIRGGPIRDGIAVRIADVNGKIARLEILR